eukprot:TRINITY_DN6092_c0_g1_i2.p1 TRINITY_DN6092_c0_g1~~TRINITY_DN6092_c0_g1_i2.p1  ORF type:complete len:762 (+),score=152.02 TRINITY_DN6092_c0_g1_i2:145-2430(+)
MASSAVGIASVSQTHSEAAAIHPTDAHQEPTTLSISASEKEPRNNQNLVSSAAAASSGSVAFAGLLPSNWTPESPTSKNNLEAIEQAVKNAAKTNPGVLNDMDTSHDERAENSDENHDNTAHLSNSTGQHDPELSSLTSLPVVSNAVPVSSTHSVAISATSTSSAVPLTGSAAPLTSVLDTASSSSTALISNSLSSSTTPSMGLTMDAPFKVAPPPSTSGQDGLLLLASAGASTSLGTGTTTLNTSTDVNFGLGNPSKRVKSFNLEFDPAKTLRCILCSETQLASILDVDDDLCVKINQSFAYECPKCQYESKTQPAAKRKKPRGKKKTGDMMVPDEAASMLLAMSAGKDGSAPSVPTPGQPLSAAEKERYSKSQLFNGLQIGLRVVICRCSNKSRSDIIIRRPTLEGQTGVVVSLPKYPCTWVGVRLEDGSGEVVKVRSSNFRMMGADAAGQTVPVQTDRLRKSLLFNNLGPGQKVLVLSHKKYKPRTGFPIHATVICQPPAFPCTWLTVKVDEDGETLKVRTSQIARDFAEAKEMMARNEENERRKEAKRQAEATSLGFRPAIADLPKGMMPPNFGSFVAGQPLNLNVLLAMGASTSTAGKDGGLAGLPLPAMPLTSSSHSLLNGPPSANLGMHGFANPFTAGPQIVKLPTTSMPPLPASGSALASLTPVPMPTASLSISNSSTAGPTTASSAPSVSSVNPIIPLSTTTSLQPSLVMPAMATSTSTTSQAALIPAVTSTTNQPLLSPLKLPSETTDPKM